MEKRITFSWLTPANIVTYSGMVFVGIAYYYLYTGDIDKGIKWFIAAVLSDWLDGFVAKNKVIQMIFGGRGVSKQGKALDPIRDAMLRASIFVLAIISGIKLTLPIIIATLALSTLIFFNRPINRMLKEVEVTQAGRVMQAIDCLSMTAWFAAIYLDPMFMKDIGISCLWLMLVTAVIRLRSYHMKYLDVEEMTRARLQ